MSLKCIFNKILNHIIPTSTLHDREISDSRSFTKLDLEGYKFSRLLSPGIVPSIRSNVHLLDNYNPSGPTPSQTGSSLVRKPGLVGHHRTKRFILKLIDAFFDLSYDSNIKLPGYFKLHPEGTLTGDTSALLELSRKLNDLGGDFYSFGEFLFKDAWQKEQIFWPATVDKFEDFFTYCTALNQKQAASGLQAVDDYVKEMGYYTRLTTAGKLEWDVAKDLQTAISRELGRWVSLREMGTMFRGREYSGNPSDDSFFIRRIQGTEQKFRKDSIGDLLSWIEDIISWNHDGVDYSIQLSGDNYNLAKHSLSLYNDHVYNSKNVYVVDEEAPNVKSLKIINTLLLGYSEHPGINKNFAKKGIAFRPLFERLEAYNWRVCRGESIEFSEKQVKHLLFKAKEDAMQLFAPRKFQTLINQIKDLYPHWWLTTFGMGKVDTYTLKDMIHYYRTYEPRMENYYKLALMNPSLVSQHSINRYYPGFLGSPGQSVDGFLKRQQARIMLRQWGGRNPIDGTRIPTDSLGYPLVSITAHHYEYAAINPLNFYDCRISALVPILSADHLPTGTVHTIQWYNRFRLSKEAIAEGRIPVPMWWDNNIRLEYIRELKAQGFRNFISLIYDPP